MKTLGKIELPIKRLGYFALFTIVDFNDLVDSPLYDTLKYLGSYESKDGVIYEMCKENKTNGDYFAAIE